jgi:hypothetical protein
MDAGLGEGLLQMGQAFRTVTEAAIKKPCKQLWQKV